MNSSSPLTSCSHFWCMWCWPQANLCGSLKRRHVFNEPVTLSCLTSFLSFHWTPMAPGLAVIRIFHKVSHVVALLPPTNSCLCSSSAWVIGPSGSHKKKQTSCWWRTVYWMTLSHVSALGNMSMNQIHCRLSIDLSSSCIIGWLWKEIYFFLS